MVLTTTRSRKAKGARLQNWIRDKISEVTGIRAGKDELIASRPMGQSGTDIILIGEAAKKFPFSVEAKNQENFSLAKWVEQARANQKEGTDWLLIMGKNRFKPIVCMDADAFFKLHKEYLDAKGN